MDHKQTNRHKHPIRQSHKLNVHYIMKLKCSINCQTDNIYLV